MPGRALAAYDAERGVDQDVYLAYPGADPMGILGYREAVLPPPHRGVNHLVAQAPPPPYVAGQVCQGALWKEGDVSWPSLPPAVTAVPAATMVPTTASPPVSRSGGPTPQCRQGSGHTSRVGGRTSCRFLEQLSGGLLGHRGLEGMHPPAPWPHRLCPARGHGPTSWTPTMRQQGRPRGWAQLLSGAASGLHMVRTLWGTPCTCPWGARGPTCPPTWRLSIRP